MLEGAIIFSLFKTVDHLQEKNFKVGKSMASKNHPFFSYKYVFKNKLDFYLATSRCNLFVIY